MNQNLETYRCEKSKQSQLIARNNKGRPRKYPLKSGRYKCDSCSIYFSKPSTLQKHKRVHSNERPYSCQICHIDFKTISNLNKHLKSKAHLLLEYRLKEENSSSQNLPKIENYSNLLSIIKNSDHQFREINDMPIDLDIYSGILIIRGSDAEKCQPGDKANDYHLSFLLYKDDFFDVLEKIRVQKIDKEEVADLKASSDSNDPCDDRLSYQNFKSSSSNNDSEDYPDLLKKPKRIMDDNDLPDIKRFTEIRKRYKSGGSRRELHTFQNGFTSIEEEKLTRDIKIKLHNKLMRANSDSYGILNSSKELYDFSPISSSLAENKSENSFKPFNEKDYETKKFDANSFWRSAVNDEKIIVKEISEKDQSNKYQSLNIPKVEKLICDDISTKNGYNQKNSDIYLNESRNFKNLLLPIQKSTSKHCLDTGQLVKKPPKKRKFDEDSPVSNDSSLNTSSAKKNLGKEENNTENTTSILFNAIQYHEDSNALTKNLPKLTVESIKLPQNSNNIPTLIKTFPAHLTNDEQAKISIASIMNLINQNHLLTSKNQFTSVSNKTFNCCERFFKTQSDLIKHKKSRPHCDKNGNILLSKKQDQSIVSKSIPIQSPNVNACDLTQEMPMNLINQPFDQSGLRANYEQIIKNDHFSFGTSKIHSDDSQVIENSYNFAEVKFVKCELCRQDIKFKFYQAHLLTHKVAGSDNFLGDSPNCDEEDPSNSTLDSLNTNTSSRPHVCQVCNKGFRVEGHLIKHYRSKAHLTSAIQKAGFPTDTMDKIPKHKINIGDLIDKKNGALNSSAISRLNS